MEPRPDWSKYGLAESMPRSEEKLRKEKGAKEDELFNVDAEKISKPWWRTSFMLTEAVQFGTWDGVFTSCMLNIFGVVIFLRTGWMLGIAGLGYSVLIIMLTMMVALIAVIGAIGVCERCQIEAGGVYFLVSHVLGSRVGASMGFLYCFGQAVASSLYIAGFGESICSLVGYTNPWIAKGIGIGVILLLLAINLAGIKWVIRLQLILLLILFVSVLDFLVGSFVKQTPAAGVVGFSMATFRNNTAPQFSSKHDFFSVFGIFFPTATGVCAGINMSGDLRNPKRSIPIGTLAALGVSFLLYLCFAVVLAGKCSRFSLQNDNMITSKVAMLGPLLLFGLYVSTLSSALGGISTAPKLLRTISETTKLPGTRILSESWGRNKVPAVAILCVTTITLSFVLIGDVDVLGPIVTMPFLLTYGTLSYAYFVLAKSFDIKRKREQQFQAIVDCRRPKNVEHTVDSKRDSPNESKEETKFLLSSNDLSNEILPTSSASQINRETLDKLFPERRILYGSTVRYPTPPKSSNEEPACQLVNEIVKQPQSFYSRISNRWVSLFGSVMFMSLMFAVNWIYAVTSIGTWILLYIYVGYVSPGLFPGVSEFSLWNCISTSKRMMGSDKRHGEVQLLLPSETPIITTQAAFVTDSSKDFVARENYHQSKMMSDDNVLRALAGQESDN